MRDAKNRKIKSILTYLQGEVPPDQDEDVELTDIPADRAEDPLATEPQALPPGYPGSQEIVGPPEASNISEELRRQARFKVQKEAAAKKKAFAPFKK